LKSTDGKAFSSIGQVKGNGTTTAKNTYSLVDGDPSVGTAYYQLRQIDFDGKATLSTVVAVQNGGNKLHVFPTLASDKLTVNAADNEVYNIFDLLGKNVQSGKLSTQKELIISDLVKGVYILNVGNEAVKFFKN
jgi:trimeric autotransporter adhesin